MKRPYIRDEGVWENTQGQGTIQSLFSPWFLHAPAADSSAGHQMQVLSEPPLNLKYKNMA